MEMIVKAAYLMENFTASLLNPWYWSDFDRDASNIYLCIGSVALLTLPYPYNIRLRFTYKVIGNNASYRNNFTSKQMNNENKTTV